MSEPTPELAELNAALLNDPAAIASHPLLSILAKRESHLGFLCPLARALVQLVYADCDAASAEAALESCWIVDDSAVNRSEDWEPGDNQEVVETVEHQLNVDFQGKTIPLIFRSEADLLYCSEEYKEHVVAATLGDLLAKQGDLSLVAASRQLVDWLMGHAGNPISRPEGEDEPLCTIRYRLCGIGSVEVDGPALVNGYHEISLEGLNDLYQQRPDDEAFCWLHALDASQAEQLGIATAVATSNSLDSDTPPPYPSWVSQEADVEACWLSAEQLQESYALGRRLRQGNRPVRLELGCGLDWDPSHDSEQCPDEELETGGMTFSDGHGPLISISIDPETAGVPDELKRLGPYLLRLAEVASAGKAD
jgi:hypothetical protein